MKGVFINSHTEICAKLKGKHQVTLPTLTCLGKVGGIKLGHHILATIVCYLRKLLYILEERKILNLLLMLTMGGNIAGRNKLNDE